MTRTVFLPKGKKFDYKNVVDNLVQKDGKRFKRNF